MEQRFVPLNAPRGENQVAAALPFLSPATARIHVSHAMVKLAARDRAQLVVIAYQTGMVSPQQ